MRAAIYVRQSLDRSGEGLAIARQEADCRELIERRGWELTEVYRDNDISASSGKPRPGYRRLQAAMRARSVDVVVCWAVDRLVRRMADLEEVITLSEKTGAWVTTVSGDLDLTTDAGRMNARILAAVAQGEVERKGARQRRANKQRAETGHVGWTRRPFGYDRRDGVVYVVEDEAQALKDAAHMVIGGETLAAVCRELNRRGLWTTGHRVVRDEDGEPVRDPDGKPQRRTNLPWNVKALRGALLNPRYAGEVTYNGATVDAKATWPAILDAGTQEQVRAVLSDPRRKTAQDTAVRYWLSGLVCCGRCGAPMFASPMGSKEKRWMVYRCRTPHLARRMDLVDAVVDRVIVKRLTAPDALELLSPSEDVSALAADAQETRRKLDDLGELVGVLPPATIKRKAVEFQARLDELQARIAAADAGGPLAALVAADDVAEAWRVLPLRERRQITEQLLTATVQPVTKGARFTPEQVSIAWKATES
jgi:site-specific DNA recombinase